jgi:plasmid maintenance system killer protein
MHCGEQGSVKGHGIGCNNDDPYGLRFPPGNHLEELKGDRAGQHSVRINGQWRICFFWTATGPADVEFIDYH